jgi:hypothetical protein
METFPQVLEEKGDAICVVPYQRCSLPENCQPEVVVVAQQLLHPHVSLIT